MSRNPASHPRATGVGASISLAMVAVCGCAHAPRTAARAASCPGVAWRLEAGWLTAAGICGPHGSPAVNVALADHGWLLPVDQAAAPEAVHTLPDGGFEVVHRGRLGVLVDRYEPFPALGQGAWQRRARFTNGSAGPLDLVSTRFHLAPQGSGSVWSPPWGRFVPLADGLLLGVANWGETDFHAFEGGSTPLTAVFRSAWRLEPGQVADVGFQGIWVGRGHDAEAARAAAQSWFLAQGFMTPIAYPEWLTGGVLYEASAGGHIDSRFSDTGGFSSFARQIPMLAELGVSALWLNAVQQHKSPPNPVQGGWNHYDPRDFLQIEPFFGGEEGLRHLGTLLEQYRLRHLTEVVPHGGNSLQAKALEEHWSRERDGSPRRNWNGCGMDNAAPAWQDVLRQSIRAVAGCVRTDGVRIDVADGQGANWGTTLTPHASRSGIIAAREILRGLTEELSAAGSGLPVMLPESPARPEYFATPGAVTLGYGFETTHFIENLSLAVLADPVALHRCLRDHAEQQRGTLPPGALSVQSLNNHDTVCSSGRVLYRFGAGLHRALYAVCLALPGIPMLYQEEEIGAFFALRELNRVRRLLPWMATAEARFLDPGYAAPGVFAAWRTSPQGSVLCLVNLGGTRQTGTATWPQTACQPRPRRITNVLSGARTPLRRGTFTWELGPYDSAFLVPETAVPDAVASAPSPPSAEPAAAPAAMVWSAKEDGLEVSLGALRVWLTLPGTGWRASGAPEGDGLGLRGETGTFTIRAEAGALRVDGHLDSGARDAVQVAVDGVAEWGISGRTALLHDRFLARHHPFPPPADYRWERGHAWGKLPWGALYRGVAPVGRLWQSILEPLHPGRPALAFADSAGAVLVLGDVSTDAMNLVLTDGSDEGLGGAGRLFLRFHALDPDLHPDVQRSGLRPFWHVQGGPPPVPRPLQVSFSLAAADDLRTALAAERLPYAPGGVMETREGEQFSDMGGRLFLVKPGRVTWSNLPAMDGTYALELELRLSERSAEDTDLADAYRVSLDGRDLPLEWTRKNTWSTGNAYFATAQTPPIDLHGGGHVLSVQTLRTWCAVRPQARLLPIPPNSP